MTDELCESHETGDLKTTTLYRGFQGNRRIDLREVVVTIVRVPVDNEETEINTR